MKGLLLKNWYMTLRHYRFVLVICVLLNLVLGVLGGTAAAFPFIFYSFVMIAVMPFSHYAYDEKDRWLPYCGALPVTRAQYVSALYLSPVVGLLAFFLLGAAVHLLVGLASGSGISWENLLRLALWSICSLALPTLMMPLALCFGAEKSRIVYYVFVGAAVGMSVVLGDIGGTGLLGTVPLPLLMVGVAVLYALSWILSCVLYRGREIS